MGKLPWRLPSCPAFSQTIIPPPPPPIMEGIDGVSMKHHKWWFHTCLCHCCGSRCKWCPCFCAIPWFQSLANWFERCRCLWLAVIHGWIIRVALKRQFAAFDSLVVCEFFRQTETPWSKMTNLRAATCAIFWLFVGVGNSVIFFAVKQSLFQVFWLFYS